ncbi:MAG: PTS fructose transporter subunit IIA [Bacilli bacterium]|nr:PTS fructose transporter subunit IIA [Bacilli bacterium]
MIDSKLIQVGVSASSKDMVFDQLSHLVVQQGYARDVDAVKSALIAREVEGTTGMMDGFAIPHAKSSAITKPGVSVLKLKQGIEWEAMDGKPIFFVIALFIPETEAGSTHLQFLSKIARLLMKEEFKTALANADSTDEIVKLLMGYLGY